MVDQVAMQAALIKSADLLQWNIQPLPPNKLTGDGGLPIFPGGYLVGALLLINLLAAYIQRFKWSQQKAGVYISHMGIITLLVGQIVTDVLQEESLCTWSAGIAAITPCHLMTMN